MNMEDIFSQFGDLFESWGMGGGGFSSFFGGGSRGGGQRVRRGSDLRVRVKVTLWSCSQHLWCISEYTYSSTVPEHARHGSTSQDWVFPQSAALHFQ